jgi:hypothetical protein
VAKQITREILNSGDDPLRKRPAETVWTEG